jgi:type IV pilus assembly protein PilC
MQFQYIAVEKSGKIVEGNLEAQSPEAVLEWIAQSGLKPVSIKALGGKSAERDLKKGIRKKIDIEDKVFLTKYLALMLKVGTDLFKAIDILIADFEKPVMKAFLGEVKSTLGKGQPFYTTFAKYPKYFSPVFINLIKAGESSGHLEKIFDNLSTDLNKQWELRNKVKSSLVYPIVLVVLAIVILFLMVSLALPKIAETFTSGGIEPPAFSRIVFAIGLFFQKYMVVIIVAAVLFVLSGWIFASKSTYGKRFISQLVRKLPIVREVLSKIALQRFATTFASLMRAGTPILEALEVTAGVVGSPELKDSLMRISREGIAKGLTVGDAFKRETCFPHTVTNLIAISEQSGHMDEVLDTLAGFYESEIDSSVKNLVSFLEPALLVMIGLIVGVIALSIIMPIYQLVGQF